MADDKAFPYVKLTNEPYPKIRMTRKVLRDGASYFGPYPYHEPKLVTRTIRTIRKLFKLRSCNIEITRDLPRPCLDYYIGLCTAPCVAWGATAEQYAGQVRQAAMFLAGKQESLLDDLRQEMTRAAEAMEFERAAQTWPPRTPRCFSTKSERGCQAWTAPASRNCRRFWGWSTPPSGLKRMM